MCPEATKLIKLQSCHSAFFTIYTGQSNPVYDARYAISYDYSLHIINGNWTWKTTACINYYTKAAWKCQVTGNITCTWISFTEHNKQNQPDTSKLQQQPTADEEVQESSEQAGDVDSCPQEERNDPVEQEQLHQDPMEQNQQVNGCNIILSCEKWL